MRFIGGAIFFVVFVLLAAGVSLGRVERYYRDAAREVCDLIEEYYFRNQAPESISFAGLCREAADRQSFLPSRKANIERINQRLSMIRTSHLAVYDPSENRQMWENQGLDTGIRARMIEAELIVYQVVPGSPADRQGMKAGDSLLDLNGVALTATTGAQNGSGVFRVRRVAQGVKTFVIRPEVITEDLSPTLKDMGDGRALLKIPSYLAHYFEGERWGKINAQLANYRALVIDLRGNAGGSFPAMLRTLSPFRCGRPLIGELYRDDREGSGRTVFLLDNLDADSQVGQLTLAPVVRLKVFSGYGCYAGTVTVLVDAGTSSVAEIFTDAFLMRARSRVWGQPTAGQVVMAKWFPLKAFGDEDYLLSIPIAGYRTEFGQTLEDRGIHPQKHLDYDLQRSLAGRDSWLEDAIKSLSSENFVSK